MNENQSSQQKYFIPGEEDTLDVRRYLSLFFSNWYLFAIALFIALSIAYGINRWSQEVFTVSSTLLIRDDKLGSVETGIENLFPGSSSFKSQQNLKNEIGILKSFNINQEVIKNLKDFHIDYIAIGKRGVVESRLYRNSPFKVIFDTLDNQTIGRKVFIRILSDDKFRLEIDGDKNFSRELSFGERFSDMGFDFIIIRNEKITFDPDASNRYYFYFNDIIGLANLYRNKLSVTPIEEEASLVTLTTSGFVPEQESDYLNMLMDIYIKSGLEFKNMKAGQSLDFIEGQLDIISDSLQTAEADLENFRMINRLIDLSREGLMVQQKIEQIDGERTSVRLHESYYNYLKDYLDLKNENMDIVSPTVMGVTDQYLIRLVEELSGLQKGKKQMGMNLTESTEPLKIIESNIETVRNALKENVNSGLLNLKRTEEDIDRRSHELEDEVNKLPSTERQMINIQRKFDINNTVYTFLLEKRAEAGIAQASNVPDNRIIDLAGAYNSTRISPKERKNILLALILGLMVPLAGIILIDLLNNKIIDKKDVERGTKAPAIGFISHNNLSSELPVFEKPGSTLSEAFRAVRTNLKYFIKEASNPVISVSSTMVGEGKTFISANLAAIIASNGKKVLLVGLDLRKPRIHKIFGINNDRGMSNYLIGEEEFDSIIFKTQIENLWYAPSGPIPPNPAELIDSDQMSVFIERAKKEYDYIIIDTPPVALVTDALLVSPMTDFYVLVVRQRYTSKNTLELIEDIRKNENVKNVGIIINDISLTGYYGYGLRYGYANGYGYNYGYNYYGYYNYGKYGYSDKVRGYYKEDM